jgi:hypothetical protein
MEAVEGEKRGGGRGREAWRRSREETWKRLRGRDVEAVEGERRGSG